MVEENYNDTVFEAERDYQRYCQTLSLWSKENTIKTQKLQYFLLTNALLAIGYALAPEGARGAALLCIVGAMLSLIWMLSIGRTVFFQKRWQALLAELSVRYQSDSRFQVLSSRSSAADVPLLIRMIGAVSSKYYLLGGPIAGLCFWLWLWIEQ